MGVAGCAVGRLCVLLLSARGQNKTNEYFPPRWTFSFLLAFEGFCLLRRVYLSIHIHFIRFVLNFWILTLRFIFNLNMSCVCCVCVRKNRDFIDVFIFWCNWLIRVLQLLTISYNISLIPAILSNMHDSDRQIAQKSKKSERKTHFHYRRRQVTCGEAERGN